MGRARHASGVQAEGELYGRGGPIANTIARNGGRVPACHDEAMSYDLDDADLSFLDTAPVRITHEETVRAPISAVWEAVSDPAAWEVWFPQVKRCGWTSEETRRIGSTRTIQIGPISFDERFVEWDEDAMRYHFTVTRTSLPIARRMVEGATLADQGAGTVTVTWRSAVEPRVAWIPKGMIRQSFVKGLARGFAGLQGYLDTRT